MRDSKRAATALDNVKASADRLNATRIGTFDDLARSSGRLKQSVSGLNGALHLISPETAAYAAGLGAILAAAKSLLPFLSQLPMAAAQLSPAAAIFAPLALMLFDVDARSKKWAETNNKLAASLKKVRDEIKENSKAAFDELKSHQDAADREMEKLGLKSREKETVKFNTQAEKDDYEKRGKKLLDDLHSIKIEKDRLHLMELVQEKQRQLVASGTQWTESLRNPKEILKDTLAELSMLRDANVITMETFRRGAAKAAEEFMNARDAIKEVESIRQGIGAIDRYSMAGFSAIQQNRREDESRKAQHDETNRLLKEANQALRENGVDNVVIKQVSI